MSGSRHIEIEKLGAAIDWPPEDPRALHLRTCERCQSRLAAYQAFMTGPGAVPAGELAAARARLRAVLEREMSTAAGAGTPAGEGAVTSEPRPVLRGPARRSGWRDWRPALAAAAVLVVVSILVLGRDDGLRPPGETPLRGEAPALREPTLMPPASDEAGGLVFEWRDGPPGPKRIRVLAEDLTPLYESEPIPGSPFRLAPSAWPDRPAAGVSLYWQLAGATGAGEGWASAPLAFRLP